MANAAILFWDGTYGQGDRKTKAMRFPFMEGSVPGTSAIVTMRNVLRNYTNAKDSGYERLIKIVYEPDDLVGDVNLDVKAKIAFKDASDGKIYRIEIPAPVASMFEVQGEGDRVTAAALNAIVAAVAAAYERTFIPLWGKKIQRG